MTHFTLRTHDDSVTSTYLQTLKVDGQLLDHPGQYTASCEKGTSPLTFSLWHGRFDPAQDMDDWGFDGPSFNCLTVAHDPERILLQDADLVSIALARRCGLKTHGDTIELAYETDLVVMPDFRDGLPAYFGDHTTRLA